MFWMLIASNTLGGQDRSTWYALSAAPSHCPTWNLFQGGCHDDMHRWPVALGSHWRGGEDPRQDDVSPFSRPVYNPTRCSVLTTPRQQQRCRSRSSGAAHPPCLCSFIRPSVREWTSRGVGRMARGSAGEEEGSGGCSGTRWPGSASSGDASSCSSATMTRVFFYGPKIADIFEISFLSPGSDKI
jgi:hypothetical protein